jgi:anaerobic selenocysteine-containing dehydrogenase
VTIRLKEEIRQALEILLQKPLSRVPGYDTRALMTAADQGKIDTLLCLGGNLYGANPNSTQGKRALSKIDTIIYLATKPNQGHFHGLARQNTIILPVLARFENPHRTTTESGNNFVRLNDPGESHLRHHPGTDLMAEITFLTELADRLLGKDPINWRQLQDTSYIRQLIARTIPGYAAIANLDDPQSDPTQTEFTISDRIFHSPNFPTPSGKAQMFTTPLPHLTLPDFSDFGRSPSTPGIVVALGTGRSYGQHNTVVYQPGDKYRRMPHRNCVLMNPNDAEKAGLKEHQRVTVQGNVGQMEQVEIIYGAIRQGSAMMFYPEVNAIFEVPIDERCGTPAYKRVPVLIYAARVPT